MKKLIIICLLGSIAPQTYSVNKNDGRAHLIQQCRAIRERLFQQNDFEIIRQSAIRNAKEINASIEERFGFKPQGAASTLNVNLNALEAEHNIRLNTLVVNTVTAYLIALNTLQARSLLAELIANGFVF